MKNRIAVIAVVVVLTVSGLASAQMDKDKEMMGGKGMGMMKGGMMDKGGMMGMHSMMKSMMEKDVVATSDGGVVVIMGNKLTKYDKNLNVVKEVELKMDMEGMQKMMGDMMKMCPMMGKGMAGQVDEPKEAAEEESAEHSAHHPEE